MVRLILAVGESLAANVEEILQERTAGTWRSQIQVYRLDAETKEANNGDVDGFARKHTTAQVLVSADLCSSWLEENFVNVRRLQKDKLISYLHNWLAEMGMSWRANAEACKDKGSFNWNKVEEWCGQFARVDPSKGRRVAAAILSQLKVVSLGEMADWFDGLSDVDHNLYFIGSDPHSGDHSLINVLSARIDGQKLSDVSEILELLPGARVRLFADAAWSGGEAERRIDCLYRECDRKSCVLGPGNELFVRFAYLTDVAQDAIDGKIEALFLDGKCGYRNVKVSCPEDNRLLVKGKGKSKGLAFQNQDILDFVDPADSAEMKAVCKKIGEQIAKKRPLGTDEIASTIAFEHSIPRAMLPVLIFGGAKVKAHDGTEFVWTPLLSSKHVEHPAKAKGSIHCDECPLLSKKKLPAPTAQEEFHAHVNPL